MRFIVFIFSCSLFILVACHRKTVPASQATAATEAPVQVVTTPAESKPESNPVAIEPVTGSAMEMQAGQMIYTSKCAKCHAVKPVENWTQTDWQPILKSMIHKAKLDSLEDHHVRLYVNTHAKKG